MGFVTDWVIYERGLGYEQFLSHVGLEVLTAMVERG
jgi:hypothetical protein